MDKYLKLNSTTVQICLIFFSWKVLLILISILAIKFIPLGYTDRFLGGGAENFKLAPELFSWANFDGEHYLSISIFGYKGLEQAFFPVYPLLISIFAQPFSPDLLSSLINSTLVGLIISNASFLLALLFLFNLLRIDFSKKIAYLTPILILIFPTSFYFGAVYNESLFLLLSVLSFLSARKGRWFLASVFGMVASATRIFGILLLPALLIEVYLQKEKISKSFWLILIPLGIGAYMMYQYLTIGDPLAFYHIQPLVGEQRQSNLVVLPQVYFRYIKMIFTVDLHSPIYQTILLEFIVGIVFFILPIYGYFKKIRLSYLFYGFVGFLITTVQGSFSSVPRYVIVFFPSFIVLALLINNLPGFLRKLIVLGLILLLIIETALFLRGYWVA
ncbi:MAG: mannosyltransferase family protein [Candidatus Daviesbacteria bacterium]|nr:mannosyltransferase family protein [Candidatus Daviesbacteria bacterium]